MSCILLITETTTYSQQTQRDTYQGEYGLERSGDAPRVGLYQAEFEKIRYSRHSAQLKLNKGFN